MTLKEKEKFARSWSMHGFVWGILQTMLAKSIVATTLSAIFYTLSIPIMMYIYKLYNKNEIKKD